MIYYTTKNALPVKQKMKNAFCGNHIFTRFNLDMGHSQPPEHLFPIASLLNTVAAVLVTCQSVYQLYHVPSDIQWMVVR